MKTSSMLYLEAMIEVWGGSITTEPNPAGFAATVETDDGFTLTCTAATADEALARLAHAVTHQSEAA